MAWRMPQILMAMAAVLVLGVGSVWVMEGRMGGATVPGLVLIEAPFADSETLAAALQAALEVSAENPERSNASMGQCRQGDSAFGPFDLAVLERLRGRGDTLVLYVPTSEVDGGAAASTAWQSVLPGRRPEDTGPADRAVGLLASSQQLTSFCIGLVLEADAGLVDRVVPQLLDAMGELPLFRRVSLVVLGAPLLADPSQRTYLRIDRGPWKGKDATDLEDLLEGGW